MQRIISLVGTCSYILSEDDGQILITMAALKKKHSKTGDEGKYHGTVIGRCHEVGEIQVEGGSESSIGEWIYKQSTPTHLPTPPADGAMSDGSRPPSSGLSSVGDRLDDEPMDIDIGDLVHSKSL